MADEPKSEEDADALRSRRDVYIQEIEGMDDYWGSTFRAVYERDEQLPFMEQLEERVRDHDRAIERMCNFHYQGFIDSIRELLQVRSEASKLKGEVSAVNGQLTETSRQLLRRGDALVRARRVQINIQQGVEALQACLPVLVAYAKLRKQMQEKRFYQALRTLEHLENAHLPPVAGYRFSQTIRDNIPRIRDSIKEASMSDLKDFLEEVRRRSPRIGEVAMRHAAEQHGLMSTQKPSVAILAKRKTQAFLETDGITAGPIYDEEEPASLSLEPAALQQDEHDDIVNCSPLYRCLHIHSALGDGDTFQTYFRMQRGKQARLALESSSGMGENLALVREFLHGVAGFFVVEDHILNTTSSGLVTRQYIGELWTEALGRGVVKLRSHAACYTEPAALLTFKRLMMVFSHTLRNYGLAVQPLHELLLEARDHYNEMLMRRWVLVFRDIFDHDNYHPIEVETADEFDQIVDVFPYSNEQLEKTPYPRRFPFSMMVPKVYSQVKEFIHSCLRFSEDLSLSLADKDEVLRRSTNVLLTRTLSGCLTTLVRRPGLGLLQLIQISINTIHLEQASLFLEQVITKITGYNPKQDGGVQSRLVGRSMFKDIRADTEQQIYMELQAKIDEFLELAVYDWLLAEPDGAASSYLLDLVYFLRSTFEAFTNLPPTVAQTACMSGCQHLARALLGMLLGDAVKQVSTGALQQLNLDVLQCEQFAASDPVPGFEEGALLMCFADLRQLLDLLLAWDWTLYFEEYGTVEARYSRVSPAAAATVVEKIREADKKNMFSVLKRSERDRKKMQDGVLKQLRQLENSGKET